MELNSKKRQRSPSEDSKKSRSRSRQKKVQWDQQKYDNFLLIDKKNTFKRLDSFKTLSSHIRHECLICSRIWKPSPKMCLQDDYYCPSCVLHHRNNIQRFMDPKLSWTASVPNTFYVYRVMDSVTKEIFLKYGRTQHLSSIKRYSSTERDRYNMELVYQVRGPLINTTAVENLWKSVANELNLKPRFSDKDFHGATQCILTDTTIYDILMDCTKDILKMDLTGYKKYGWKDLSEGKRDILVSAINTFLNK